MTGATSTRSIALTTAFAPVLWGSTWIAITELMPPNRPLLTATLRALPTSLLMLVLIRRLPTGRWWLRANVLALLNIGAFFALLTTAAYRVPGGVGATMGALQPLMVLAFAMPLLGLAPRRAQVGAGIAGVVGVALLVLGPGANLDLIGILAGVAAVASMGVGMVLAQRWADPDVSPLVSTTWQLLFGGIMLAVLSLATEGSPPALTANNALGVLWLGLVCTGFANWLWFRGLTRLPAARLSFLNLLGPIGATAIGWLALGESLTPLQLLGATIAIASVAAGQRTPRSRALSERAHDVEERRTQDDDEHCREDEDDRREEHLHRRLHRLLLSR